MGKKINWLRGLSAMQSVTDFGIPTHENFFKSHDLGIHYGRHQQEIVFHNNLLS